MGFLVSSSTICPVDLVSLFTIDSYFFQVSNIHFGSPYQTGAQVSVLTTNSVFQHLLGICVTESTLILQNPPLSNVIYCSTKSNTFMIHLWHSLPIPDWYIYLHLFFSWCRVSWCMWPTTSSVRLGWNLSLIMGLVARRWTGVRSREGKALSFNIAVSFEPFVQSSRLGGGWRLCLLIRRSGSVLQTQSIQGKLVVRDS